MIRDAVVDEVRAIRDELAKECGYDIHKLFESFRHLEASSATNHASSAPRSGDPETAEQIDPADEEQSTPAPRR
ncbi:uncharacterized protein SOCE26_088420 [Sorangium cellulosum]|uniref:Uncharacterized protein n=1 Tax=Sorangium cellulosum TaxID=56 RepID=A0A2L0F711_SORCE|nr:hypothetical protein [Sorangium cellulosum]AUX47323.1 uncharacterized protein SOCE26_088420 [Sorangium cellulosum]